MLGFGSNFGSLFVVLLTVHLYVQGRNRFDLLSNLWRLMLDDQL